MNSPTPMFYDGKLTSDNPLRQQIHEFYHLDESAVIDVILPLAEISMPARTRAWERARKMVHHIRREQSNHYGVDALLKEYSLSTEEGVALMCLAEALLRVPDKQTQNELIRDKLTQGQWASHLGNSESLFVNASSWGLLFSGNMVSYTDARNADQFGVLKKALGRLGEPVIRSAMNIAMEVMGQQFVLGETIEKAVARAKQKEQQGYGYSYDMLGEGARTMADADVYFKAYEAAIHAIGQTAKQQGPRKAPGISVKLSAIYPRYEPLQRDAVLEHIPARLKQLCLLAKKYDIGLTVDAEEAERLELSLDIIEQVFTDDDLGDWEGFGLAVQAYQKRAIWVIDWLKELTDRTGRKLMVRLVKGAYWDTEIKHAQKAGLTSFPVFTRKASTDVNYQACANKLLSYRDTIYPQFATHNAYTAATIMELAGDDKDSFEFQCLHGMGGSLYEQLVKEEGIQCRIYAPVGKHEDLLAYLVRRLLENGANSSFVNAIVDDSQPIEALLEDPVEKTQRLATKYNTQITKPTELYGDERPNSKGLDLSDTLAVEQLKRNCDKWLSELTVKRPIDADPQFEIKNPANLDEVIGYQTHLTVKQMAHLLDNAAKAYPTWSTTPVTGRAELLRKTADALEEHMDELIALCIKEAGKIAQDGIDEVREAVDFCRYYAARAEEVFTDDQLTPRGVVVCISPWNFPLAIFLGQVAAAVVTGNTVLAKPAEQTSLIATRAIELMYAVGLPKHVVQLIIARGSEVGKHILPDHRISAVMFTGSTATGTMISQILAQRGGPQVPLIAETGGQNCMVVDSTALPEQVVDDVITSGFQSAGQRCSALRVLYVQDDIADKLAEMLIGAMQELTIGDPSLLATDIGPVIDQRALTSLENHVEYMKEHGKLLYCCEPTGDVSKGTYFMPRLYEIENIDVLPAEVFGPCVHLIRFAGTDLHKVIDQINATGYGLTMGIHSRIEDRAFELAQLSRAGNVYINRNMIGAIVGSQPFGGRGLSGTGPKAGGPNYLRRLTKEKATPTEISCGTTTAAATMASDTDAAVEASHIMQNAVAVENAWRLTPLNDRISLVRQFLAKIAKVEIAEDIDETLATAREQLMFIEQKLKEPIHLPGPTGEANILSYEPRGTLVCYADDDVTFEYWFQSIITALATGNVVVSVVAAVFYQEAMAFREKFLATGAPANVLQVTKLEHLDALLMDDHLAGVVVDSQTNRRAYIAARLADRTGAILPIITAEYLDNLVQRLLTEKTISIDTTASGGNASLMTMVEDDR